MSRSKGPVVFVAVALCALIVLPVLILLIVRGGGAAAGGGGGGAPPTENGRPSADFDLRRLAERAEGLVEGEMADALRRGDVSLDFMADLKRGAEKGREALVKGDRERARKLYGEVVQTAEAKLEQLKLAEKARALNDTVYAELERLDYLEPVFANSFKEAKATYNEALRDLNVGGYAESVDGFEMAGAILGDLEARGVQRIGGLLDAGNEALGDYELAAARKAFESVLEIQPENGKAKEGLARIEALEGIEDEVREVRELEEAGKLEAALARLEALARTHPGNAFITGQIETIQAKIRDRDFKAAVARADAAEAEGDLAAAIAGLEDALKLKESTDVSERLAALKERYKATRLEALLSDGFEALKAGRYENARDAYKEAVDLAPDSKEARAGYEKASSLFLANIRYTQNLANAEKYIEEGRFPLASKFFNEAMAARPNKVSSVQAKREADIRKTLETQNKEVPVLITSDNRTFVSIIGVLPPGKLRSEELKLFPDVYTVRGQRDGYKDVEIEFKVDATKPMPKIEVVADERR